MERYFDQFIYLIVIVAKIGIVLICQLALGVPVMAWAERRGAGFIQMRPGPNRVGYFGILQPFADAIKFFFKEDVIPTNASKVLYVLAPILAIIPAIMAFAVIPFGRQTTLFGLLSTPTKLEITSINAGALYVFAILSMGIYGILASGWASNNKYSLFGGLRGASQMISYELSLVLSAVSVFVLAGSVDLRAIVEAQKNIWFLIPSFLGFIVFLVAIFAETNRIPFDLPEGDSEIVAGYHTEYSSMKFALFFMAEYVNMITVSALLVLLFLGGWHPLPFLSWDRIIGLVGMSQLFFDTYLFFIPVATFVFKTGFMLFVFIWARWTLPRFRYDQLMFLGWRRLLPIAILNLFLVSFILVIANKFGINFL